MQKILLAAVLLLPFVLKGQDLAVLDSKFLKTGDSVLVYKPVSYSSSVSYPVVFLLHGHSANFRSWSRLADLQHYADKYNYLIVCPDGLKKSWYINSPHQDSVQYERFFMEEFLPYIREHYNVNQKKFFITGASMGGYGAMYLFLNHPDVFLSAGSTSGVLNLRYSGFKKTTLAYLLGPYTAENTLFDDYSVVNMLKNIQGMDRQIIFDSGTEDYLYITARKFREKCDELKIKATYTARPGGHTGRYWSEAIPAHFEFFNRLASATN